MNQTIEPKTVYANGLHGERLAIKLYESENKAMFSDEYYVTNVQNGNFGRMKAETLKIILGKKEYSRVRLEARTI